MTWEKQLSELRERWIRTTLQWHALEQHEKVE